MYHIVLVEVLDAVSYFQKLEKLSMNNALQ